MSELSFGEAENWVDFVERQIGYKFVNRDLLVQAFVRKSYSTAALYGHPLDPE